MKLRGLKTHKSIVAGWPDGRLTVLMAVYDFSAFEAGR